MNYLGHNEFGINHRSWNNSIIYKDFNNLNYWIEQWILFYENILYKYKNYKNCYFIKYEKLQDPKYNKNILQILELSTKPKFNLKVSEKKLNINFDEKLYLRARKIYESL